MNYIDLPYRLMMLELKLGDNFIFIFHQFDDNCTILYHNFVLLVFKIYLIILIIIFLIF